MFGALEARAMKHLAEKYGALWQPRHAAVMGYLMAHQNRRTGRCDPPRRDTALACGCSIKTVNRALEDLVAWGALEKVQRRALASGKFRPVQYKFLFAIEGHAADAPQDTAVSHGPWDKKASHRGTKNGSPQDTQVSHGNKEEARESKAKKSTSQKAQKKSHTLFLVPNHPSQDQSQDQSQTPSQPDVCETQPEAHPVNHHNQNQNPEPPERQKPLREIKEIASHYPKIDDAFNLPDDLVQVIADAIRRDGKERVLAGTMCMEAVVKQWPIAEMRFLPSPEKYFKRSQYRKPPEFWERRDEHGSNDGPTKAQRIENSAVDAVRRARRAVGLDL